MARYELTDSQWQLIEAQLPRNKGAGRPWHDHRKMLNGILWVLRSGAPWRDLPVRYGKWGSVHNRFNRWRADGTWDNLAEHLLQEMDQAGMVDRDLWCIDGSNVRASRAAAGAKKRAGRRAC